MEKMIEACARAAHEVNRAYCAAIGDASQVAWEDAPEWQKSSARNGVRGALAGNTPEQSHESWLAEKAATGWKFGPVKNADTKEHPCFVPYAELPPSQRAKDALFIATVQYASAAFEVGARAVKDAAEAACSYQLASQPSDEAQRAGYVNAGMGIQGRITAIGVVS